MFKLALRARPVFGLLRKAFDTGPCRDIVGAFSKIKKEKKHKIWHPPQKMNFYTQNRTTT